MSNLLQVTVKAPATSANFGPGFDVFGLALDCPWDEVTLSLTRRKGIKIKVLGIHAETIPVLPEQNTAGVVANYIITKYGLDTGLTVQIDKGIWPGMGLGSSAAPAAAVAYGLNHMFNLNLSQQQLISFAAKGEVASAGSEHADNVSAAICGGFVILKSYTPLEIICLKAPENMAVVIAFPHTAAVHNKTQKARSVVPRKIPIEKMVCNIGNAASMAVGFASGDLDLIGKSMSDAVVEHARAVLIPGYKQVRENALKSGACGVTISGAGPAMLALINKKRVDSSKVASAMKEGFESAGFEATAFAANPGRGVTVIEK